MSHFHRIIRQRIHNRLNRTPLWLAFMELIALFLLILTLILTRSNYVWNRERAIREYVSFETQQLELRVQNLEFYFDKLSDFCVLPVNESLFYNNLLTTRELSASELAEIASSVKIYFYTRSDLEAYRIDLLNQDCSIGRAVKDNRMKLTRSSNLKESEDYLDFLAHEHYGSSLSSAEGDDFVTFRHSIIRIQSKDPVALVSIVVNDKQFRTGNAAERNLSIFRDDDTLLYTLAGSDLRSLLNDSSFMQRLSEDDPILKTDKGEYLYASVANSRYGFRLVSLISMEELADSLSQILVFSFMQGVLFLLLSLFISYLLIRFLTEPLRALANSQNAMSEGKFTQISIGRSREVSALSESFNNMSAHIDHLINENLAAILNEKTAQLIALEAQVNPHFLYNTLQAIGTKALLNDQPEVYDMLTVLARSFHYSIKAPNQVPLREETAFVSNYVMLQKIRMEDRLSISIDIKEELLSISVPKCCLQTLIENSINHGISGNKDSISITVTAVETDGTLTILVSDNGAGIPPEKLEILQHSFTDSHPLEVSQSIGLANLYHRLRIMYGEKADLIIESSENAGTRVSIILKEWRENE